METINPYLLFHKMKPELRLQMLHAYLCWKIDQWPKRVVVFEDWLVQRHEHLIPGTIANAKFIATRCYYCNEPFSTVKAKQPTHDHHYPKSAGYTERHVVCCYECNNRKADIKPEVLISNFNSAIAYNRPMWGYSGKKLRFVAGQFEKIFRDQVNGTGPTIYYFKN